MEKFAPSNAGTKHLVVQAHEDASVQAMPLWGLSRAG
jgi:hypothetical protein